MVYPRLWRVTSGSILPCVLVLCALVSAGFLSRPAFATAVRTSGETLAQTAPLTAPSAAGEAPARGEEKMRLPASLPLKRDDDSDIGIGRIWIKEVVLLAVLMTAVAIVLIRKQASSPESPALRRAGQGWLNRKVSGEAGRPRIESTTRLTNRASVHVVHWDGKEWLVGCTEQNMIVLGQRSSRSGPSDWPGETSLSRTVSRDGSASAPETL